MLVCHVTFILRDFSKYRSHSNVDYLFKLFLDVLYLPGIPTYVTSFVHLCASMFRTLLYITKGTHGCVICLYFYALSFFFSRILIFEVRKLKVLFLFCPSRRCHNWLLVGFEKAEANTSFFFVWQTPLSLCLTYFWLPAFDTYASQVFWIYLCEK